MKLVGDWIDREVGDLAPLWSDDVLKTAIDAAHANGARVTAHVFGEDALPGLINAGIDCIEHGTGITDDTIELMLDHGTALVPTLINVDNFPGIADNARRYPAYAEHMRALYAQAQRRVGAARDAGVLIYAGTDAGGGVGHGRIADEVDALKGIGMSPTDALGGGGLGCPALAGTAWPGGRRLGRPAVLRRGPAARCRGAQPARPGGAARRRGLSALRACRCRAGGPGRSPSREGWSPGPSTWAHPQQPSRTSSRSPAGGRLGWRRRQTSYGRRR